MNTLKQVLDGVLAFLEKYMPLASCNSVDYFTKSLYTNINENIRNEIANTGFDDVLSIIFNKTEFNETYLTKFIKDCRSYSLYNLPNVCMDIKDLHNELKQLGCDKVDGLKLKAFIKPKKSHEVEILSAIASAIHYITKASHLIDIGDGKGYLSSMLALHYQIPVLGIDSSFINTSSATKRAEKLQKVWHGITKNPNRSVLTKSEERFSTNGKLYKQITHRVSDNTNLQILVKDIFLETPRNVGIIGLHTCGDLASTSLKLFNKNHYIKSICNISCCYHLLTETDDGAGFPMSKYLKNKTFKLGRNARMLSAQSIDRIIFNKQLPNNSIFYRAILQVILEKTNGNAIENVGKLKNCNSFIDYCRAALKRIDYPMHFADNELENYYKMYESKHQELNTFILLRSMLAPAIETLILIDKLLYLYEEGITNAYLVKLFDPVISPRCYGIIAIKT